MYFLLNFLFFSFKYKRTEVSVLGVFFSLLPQKKTVTYIFMRILWELVANYLLFCSKHSAQAVARCGTGPFCSPVSRQDY